MILAIRRHHELERANIKGPENDQLTNVLSLGTHELRPLDGSRIHHSRDCRTDIGHLLDGTYFPPRQCYFLQSTGKDRTLSGAVRAWLYSL